MIQSRLALGVAILRLQAVGGLPPAEAIAPHQQRSVNGCAREADPPTSLVCRALVLPGEPIASSTERARVNCL